MSSKPPDKPTPSPILYVTFKVHGKDYIDQLYAQLEWLKGLTDKEIKKQTKIKIE